MLLASLGISHLLFQTRTRRWRQVILGWAVGAGTFLPYLPLLFSGSFAFGSTERSASAVEVVQAFAKVFANGLIILWFPLLICFGYALWRCRKTSVLQMLTVALIMLASLLVANMQFKIIPITRIRYLLVLWWIVTILVAYGLVSVPRWKSVSVVFVLLWCIAGFFFGRSEVIFDYSGFISFARKYPPLHNYVDNLLGKTYNADYMVGFTDQPWINHDREVQGVLGRIDYYIKVQLGIDAKFIDVLARPWEIRRDIRFVLNEHPYVLFAHNPQQFQQQVETALDVVRQDYLPCDVLADKPDLVIQRYVFRLLGCDHVPAPVNYDNGIKLVDRGARYDETSKILQALTWWEVPDESLLDEYNVSLQVVTPDWQKHGIQVDRHLSDSLLPWNVIELSTADLPAEHYRLMLILYNRHTGESELGRVSQSDNSEKFIELLAFAVQ